MSNSPIAILLLAHGSRATEANVAMFQVAADLKASGQYELVECAFLEMTSPDITTGLTNCREAGAGRIIIMPYFLHLGRHVQEDLPGIIKAWSANNPGVEVTMAAHLGYSPKLTELVQERISEVR